MWLPVYRYTLHPPLFYMDQKRTRHRRRRAQVLLYHSPSRGASNVSLAMFYVSRGVSRPVSEDSRASRFEAFCFLARLLACEISDRLESDFVADDSGESDIWHSENRHAQGVSMQNKISAAVFERSCTRVQLDSFDFIEPGRKSGKQAQETTYDMPRTEKRKVST